MLVLNAAEVRQAFPMAEAIKSNKKAFLIHSQKETEVPVRVNFNITSDSSSLFMPAFVRGDVKRAGIKIVSVFPGNVQKNLPVVTAQVLLLDNETGEVAAMMNGAEVTKIRTGAITGAATDILARKDARIGALFGTGGQAQNQLEAMLTVRRLEKVKVFDVDAQRTQAFVAANQAMAEKFNATLICAASSDEAIEDADVIATVTISKTPVFDGAKLKRGAHVTGVGSYTPDARELDFETLRSARVFVDNKEAVLAEAGDFLIPMSEGIYKEEYIAGELGEVLAKKIEGRQNDEQITVMKTVGYAVLDVMAAWNIYNKALELKIGRDIEL